MNGKDIGTIRHPLPFTAACVLAGPAVATACPFCASEIGLKVQSGIFNSEFFANAALILLPMAALTVIVTCLHYNVMQWSIMQWIKHCRPKIFVRSGSSK